MSEFENAKEVCKGEIVDVEFKKLLVFVVELLQIQIIGLDYVQNVRKKLAVLQ